MPPQPAPFKVLFFHATWCQPCKEAELFLPLFEMDCIQVTVIDIDEQPSLMRKYGVTSVPTFIITQGDKVWKTQDVQVALRVANVKPRK